MGIRGENVTLQSWAQLDRSGLPSETLKLRIIKERESGGGDEGAVFKDIYALTHR